MQVGTLSSSEPASAKATAVLVELEEFLKTKEILQVPDLDGVLIGPHDLSCSLGIPEQYDHPDFLNACETIFNKARKASVGAGVHFWGDVEQQTRLLKLPAGG